MGLSGFLGRTQVNGFIADTSLVIVLPQRVRADLDVELSVYVSNSLSKTHRLHFVQLLRG